MAKKYTKKKHNTNTSKSKGNILPQNIILKGERVYEDKNIYILQSIYREIHKFTKDKTDNESGGMLIGYMIEEFGKTNIVIEGFVEAKFSEGTPTTLKFTHKTWDYVHKNIEKKFPNKSIVGWIHTHPDFGIFLSEYDKFIQQNFFNQENQIAYVIDPIRNEEGFYFWINNKIEKCNGFYLYDKTGVNIDQSLIEQDKDSKEKAAPRLQKTPNIVLIIVIIILVFINVGINTKYNVAKREIDSLQQQLQEVVNKVDIDSNLQNQQIIELSNRLDELLELNKEKISSNKEEKEDVQTSDSRHDDNVESEE